MNSKNIPDFRDKLDYPSFLLKHIKMYQQVRLRSSNPLHSFEMAKELVMLVQPPELKESIRKEVKEELGRSPDEYLNGVYSDLKCDYEKKDNISKSDVKSDLAQEIRKTTEIIFEITMDNLGEAGLLLDKSSYFKEELDV